MIAVIDYRAGNLTSVRLAFESIGAPVCITSDRTEILAAERVVFPGVGAAGAAMQNVAELGLSDTIRAVVERQTPFLGICLGTQIILEHSEEDGGVDTLGLIPGNVLRFAPQDPFDKVPHMGWNRVEWTAPHPVFQNLPPGSEFYFVHSYYPAPTQSRHCLAQTTYAGTTFAAALGDGNIVATQFHPEKSGRIGLRLLENFVKWTPSPDGTSC